MSPNEAFFASLREERFLWYSLYPKESDEKRLLDAMFLAMPR